MSCVLRVSGESLDLDELLVQADVQPHRVWRKGVPRLDGARLNETSGATFVMSHAGFSELNFQGRDVLCFLRDHSAWIARLAALPGVSVVADFAVELTPPYWASFVFEPRLVAALSRVGAALELSAYPSGLEAGIDA